MNWWNVLSALANHLQAQPSLAGVTISLGAHAGIPEKATVELIRGPFQGKNTGAAHNNTLTIYVECWEHSKDKNPGVGYARLADLENNVLPALLDFQQPLAALVRFARVTLDETQPDGDLFRPSIGSRTTFKIEWKS